MTNTEFVDARMCFASMGHVSPADDELLKQVCGAGSFDDIVVYTHCYGYYIYLDVCLPDNSEGYVDSLRKSGFTQEFIRLMTDAKEAGFNYMNLDRDQPAQAGRYVFDWSDITCNRW